MASRTRRAVAGLVALVGAVAVLLAANGVAAAAMDASPVRSGVAIRTAYYQGNFGHATLIVTDFANAKSYMNESVLFAAGFWDAIGTDTVHGVRTPQHPVMRGAFGVCCTAGARVLTRPGCAPQRTFYVSSNDSTIRTVAYRAADGTATSPRYEHVAKLSSSMDFDPTLAYDAKNDRVLASGANGVEGLFAIDYTTGKVTTLCSGSLGATFGPTSISWSGSTLVDGQKGTDGSVSFCFNHCFLVDVATCSETGPFDLPGNPNSTVYSQSMQVAGPDRKGAFLQFFEYFPTRAYFWTDDITVGADLTEVPLPSFMTTAINGTLEWGPWQTTHGADMYVVSMYGSSMSQGETTAVYKAPLPTGGSAQPLKQVWQSPLTPPVAKGWAFVGNSERQMDMYTGQPLP